MSTPDDHHHCKVCGKVCSPSEAVCSKACKTQRESKQASGRRSQLMMYGAMLLLIVVLVFELR
ncbi:MAG: DUF2116 family Zn-ribbon domain-containing protein [Thermoplasmata archaeon]|nr:DUF2116 family Zn-ribbon domain-containing protein [Thermoplasmata archaeon]